MSDYRIILVVLCLAVSTALNGQIWPGDINNNGEVNNVDLLYLGQVFGDTGPPREPVQQGISWAERVLVDPWDTDFPNGVNHAFADCDGDGVIDYFDENAVLFNYFETHGSVSPDIAPTGIAGIDPELSFLETGFGLPPVVEGEPVVILFSLGTEDLPVSEFSGIAFTLEYDPDYYNTFLGGFEMVFGESEWVGMNPEDRTELVIHDPLSGTIEAAIARTNAPLLDDQFGPLGALLIVIEDNVVGYGEESVETTIHFKDVFLVGADLTSFTPVFPDSLVLEILNDSLVSSVSPVLNEPLIEFSPNPADREVQVATHGQIIQEIQIYSPLGHRVEVPIEIQHHAARLFTDHLPPGTYFVQVETDQGFQTSKILIY